MGAVKGVMESTDMLAKAAATAAAVRKAGGLVLHVPIMFKADASDNPNNALGILAGCAKDALFTEKTWNSEFCESMKPADGDLVVEGKKGTRLLPKHQPRGAPRLARHRDGRALRLPHQLLRRVDHADRVREGVQRGHAHRLLRDHLGGGARGRDQGHVWHVLIADERRGSGSVKVRVADDLV